MSLHSAHIELAFSATLAVVGCASTRAPRVADPVDPPPAYVQPRSTPRSCPLGVGGARAVAADRDDGVDVTFTTDRDIEQLRHRVRDQAAGYGPGAHKGLGHWGAHSGGHMHGLRLWELPPLIVRVEDVDLGARLHIASANPARRDEVRAFVHERVNGLELGTCPPQWVAVTSGALP